VKKRFPLSENDLNELYWSRELSTHQIARLTGFSQMTVFNWMKKYMIKRREKNDSHCKRVDIDLSPTLSYVLGVCFGDGTVYKMWCRHLNRHRYEVALHVRNKIFAESFKAALEKQGFKVRLYTYNGWWHVFANSKIFYRYFSTLTLNDLRSILKSDELAKAFIRGFYESEGSYCLCYHKRWNYFNEILVISNTNLGLLKLIQELLRRWGIEFHIYGPFPRRPERSVYALQTAQKELIGRFLKLVEPSIKYKPSSKRLGLG